MTTMKIKAIAPWFGGKRTMAPAIVKELGKHTQYFEPFCGSMAVLFAKEQSRAETVNDLHAELINLARVIQGERAAELYDRLDRTLFHEDLLKASRAEIAAATAPVDRAYWYFLHSWMGRNGIAGTDLRRGPGVSIAVSWTANGGSPTVRFKSCVESVPWWHARLQNVVILNRDAFGIIEQFEDSAHTAIYVDPPYLSESRSGFKGSGAHSRYEHEFQHGGGLFDDDHARLADALKRFAKSRVVISYYDCERARQLYDGWTFVCHAREKNLAVMNGKGAKSVEAPEVLIINGPSYAEVPV